MPPKQGTVYRKEVLSRVAAIHVLAPGPRVVWPHAHSKTGKISKQPDQPRMCTEASAAAVLNIQRMAAIIPKAMLFLTQQREVAKLGLQIFMSVQ